MSKLYSYQILDQIFAYLEDKNALVMIYGQYLEIPTLVDQPFCKARQFFFFLSFFQLLFKEKGPLCALQKEKALPESLGLVIKIDLN